MSVRHGSRWVVLFSVLSLLIGLVGRVEAAPVRVQSHSDIGQGYWMVATDGGIFSFGDMEFYGSTGNIRLNKPIVGMAPTKSGLGYWLVASDGGIFSFGDAAFHGSTGAITLNKPIVGMAATPTGNGYWLVASDGGIFSFGDAAFFGSTGNIKLNQPIVGMASTASGKGYWMVASDGGIFSFGDAAFYGSMGGTKLNKPVVGMAATRSGNGYWFVATDGGIFSFGDAEFFGSTGDIKLNQPIVGMAVTPSGRGYWLVASDGGIFASGNNGTGVAAASGTFGDAQFLGSMGGTKLNRPIVGIASPRPLLSVQLTDSVDPAALHQDVTYTITVSNPGAAHSATVSFGIPEGAALVSSSDSPTRDGNTLTFTTALPEKGTATETVTLRYAAAGVFRATARAQDNRSTDASVFDDTTVAEFAWPSFHRDAAHSGYTPTGTVGSNPTELWRYTNDAYRDAFGGVIGSNGVLYLNTDAPSDQAGFIAVDAKTGAFRWNLDTSLPQYEGDLKGNPTIGPDGTIYITLGDYVYAFRDDTTQPTELWRFKAISPDLGDTATELDGWVGFVTLGPDGTLYVPTAHGYLVAIKPPPKDAGGAFTGAATFKWAFQSAPYLSSVSPDNADLMSQPAIAPDGTIYLGSDENRGRIWRIRDDGTEATVLASADAAPDAAATRDSNPRHDMNTPPSLDAARGQVYIGSDDGRLYAFRMSDLKLLWSAFAGGVFNPDTGKQGGSPEDSAPSIAPDGTIVIGSEDGVVYAYNPDGSTKWTAVPCPNAPPSNPPGRGVESSAAISSSGIVVIGSPCGLFAYRLSNGAQLWMVDAGVKVEFEPSIGPDGTIYYPIDTGDAGQTTMVAVTGTMGLPPETA